MGTPPTTPLRLVCRLPAAAKTLSMSENELRALLASGKIPAYRTSAGETGHWRIPRAPLEAWIAAGCAEHAASTTAAGETA